MSANLQPRKTTAVEIQQITDATPLDPNRVLCRYCARTMVEVVTSPREVAPHCTGKGCKWCAECGAGETPVSPLA